MADKDKGARMVTGFFKQRPGLNYMAIPFRVEGRSVAEVEAHVQAFAADLIELYDRHPAIRHIIDPRDGVICLRQSLAVAEATAEADAGERARDN